VVPAEDVVAVRAVVAIVLENVDVRVLVVHVPQRLLDHLHGYAGHLKAEQRGDHDRVHLDELRQHLVEDGLRAALA
jgi:hypothetical protein